MTLHIGALCAGYGGIDLAVAATDIPTQVRWVSDTDANAATVLDARFGVTNLGDLRDISRPEPVDIVTAGFPCQPVSQAGRQKGIHDERWLIEDVCRVAAEAGAGILVLENVRRILSANQGRAMAHVCEAMADHGFSRWDWTTLRASDIGAPHRRDRWFCVAYSDDLGRQRARRAWGRGPGSAYEDQRSVPHSGGHGHEGRQPEPSLDAGGLGQAGTTAPDPDSFAAWRHAGADVGPQGQHEPATADRHGPADGAAAAADTDPQRLQERRIPEGEGGRHVPDPAGGGRFGPYEAAVQRWEYLTGVVAPEPLTDGKLSPHFVEWMMGLPPGWVTDIIDNRRAALKLLGNGVVPQQARAALQVLADVPPVQ